MGYYKNFQEKVSAEFLNTIKTFVVTEKSNPTDYVGHWECRNPGSGFCWFDITVWPEVITISGDMGTYSWRRTNCMLSFVRGSAESIGYFSEKLISECSTEGAREYRTELAAEWYADQKEEFKDDSERLQKLEDLWESWCGEDIRELHHLIYDSDLYCDPCESIPDCKAFTYRYLWCVEALKWFAGTQVTENQIDARWQTNRVIGQP